MLPTGERLSVCYTPFDFREPCTFAARLHEDCVQLVRAGGYDHTFAVTDAVTLSLHDMATLLDPGTGRCLCLRSNQPGLQINTSNTFDGTSIGRSGLAFMAGEAVALEPQLFPDTPNRPAFGSARLNPGEVYRNLIVYSFWSDAD